MGRSWGPRPSQPIRSDNNRQGSNPFNQPKSERQWQLEEERLFGDAKAAGTAIESYELPVEISGSNVPEKVDSFDAECVHQGVRDNIGRAKYTNPTPVQKHSIPIVCAGRDLMSCAQTGSGKTAAFLVPIISQLLNQPPSQQHERRSMPAALILSPTRELATQIHQEALKFTFKTPILPVVAYGGANIRDQISQLRRGCHVLIATPGRLVDLMEQGYISLANIRHLCLDEADRMLDMGFEPQIRRIVQQADMPVGGIGGRQTLMFSATFAPAIQRLASDFLDDHVFLTVGRSSSTAANIKQQLEMLDNSDAKECMLLDLLQSVPGLTIIFVETKRTADALEYFLTGEGFPATSIHGDRDQREREAAIRSFKSGETPYLVATDVAARGLDISAVTHVINYELPRDIDSYVHRIGRTGRAGNKGLATSFMTYKDANLAQNLLELLTESNQDVPGWLEEMAARGGQRRGSSFKDNNKQFGATDARQHGSQSDLWSSNTESSYQSRGYAQQAPSQSNASNAYWD